MNISILFQPLDRNFDPVYERYMLKALGIGLLNA